MFVEEWESIDAVRAPSSRTRSGIAVPSSRAFVAEMRALSPQPTAIRIHAAEDITAKLMGA